MDTTAPTFEREAPFPTSTSIPDADTGAVGPIPILPPPGIYVSPDGADSNGGRSPEEPYRTVQHAVDQLTPGDTVYLMNGVYTGTERADSGIVVTASGTPDAWVRITAYPGHQPVVRGEHRNGIKVEGADYVEISNLILEGTWDPNLDRYTGSGINVDGIYVLQPGGGTGVVLNHHVRIIGNTISGFGAGGIPVTGTSHVEIRDNVVYELANAEPTQHSGISLLEQNNAGFGDDDAGYSNYITGNVVYRVENLVPNEFGSITDGNCVIVDRSTVSEYEGRTLIANNVCVQNGGRGVQVYQSAKVDVVHNTLYDNLGSGDVAAGGGELGAFESNDVRFVNNLVLAAPGIAPARAFDSDSIEFSGNVYLADTDPQYDGASSDGDQMLPPGDAMTLLGLTEAAGRRSGLAPAPTDFDLGADSPLIDAGLSDFRFELRDFLGRPRPLGGGPDPGAFEAG